MRGLTKAHHHHLTNTKTKNYEYTHTHTHTHTHVAILAQAKVGITLREDYAPKSSELKSLEALINLCRPKKK